MKHNLPTIEIAYTIKKSNDAEQTTEFSHFASSGTLFLTPTDYGLHEVTLTSNVGETAVKCGVAVVSESSIADDNVCTYVLMLHRTSEANSVGMDD
ncbi:MAG: hypothetical protein LBU62_04425 [Bacteroidales bacterium]|jgi:hypothetical protein|nr:hypothetical protein [Bacteroidales bacterium]